MVGDQPKPKSCTRCGGKCHEQYLICADCKRRGTPNAEYEKRLQREIRESKGASHHFEFRRGQSFRREIMKQVKLRKVEDYTRDERPEDIQLPSYVYHGDNVCDDCY